jgi:hypothetical protein
MRRTVHEHAGEYKEHSSLHLDVATLRQLVGCGQNIVDRDESAHGTSDYGTRSLRGTQVAALFYTLCETAKLVGVDPHAYLLRTLHSAIVRPGAVT